jgi:hypothetical protein
VFKDNVAINLEPITVEDEKTLEKLLGDMVVSKWHAWCG